MEITYPLCLLSTLKRVFYELSIKATVYLKHTLFSYDYELLSEYKKFNPKSLLNFLIQLNL